jgi:hypothetical protein
VQDYLDSGFKFVAEDSRFGRSFDIEVGKSLDSRASVNVGRAGGMENVTAYLMEIPIDEWNEMRKEMIEAARNPMKELKRQADEMVKSEAYYGQLQIK